MAHAIDFTVLDTGLVPRPRAPTALTESSVHPIRLLIRQSLIERSITNRAFKPIKRTPLMLTITYFKSRFVAPLSFRW